MISIPLQREVSQLVYVGLTVPSKIERYRHYMWLVSMVVCRGVR